VSASYGGDDPTGHTLKGLLKKDLQHFIVRYLLLVWKEGGVKFVRVSLPVSSTVPRRQGGETLKVTNHEWGRR
jgi:hypothetical protein